MTIICVFVRANIGIMCCGCCSISSMKSGSRLCRYKCSITNTPPQCRIMRLSGRMQVCMVEISLFNQVFNEFNYSFIILLWKSMTNKNILIRNKSLHIIDNSRRSPEKFRTPSGIGKGVWNPKSLNN